MNESNGSSGGANNSGNNGCSSNNKDSHKSSSQVVVTNDNIPAQPCEPGTKVLMEGIVWHETDSGMLVVNVTWRNKTYIGTLLDSTKYTWSAPRMIDNESGSESKSATRGRKKQYTRASFNHATTERKTRRSQLAAQSAMDMSTEKSRGKKSKNKNNKSKKKDSVPAAVEDQHQDDDETTNSSKKGGKKAKDDDRATPKSKKADETSDNDSKKKKTGQNRSNTPVVNKDEDYHPKKRYKQTPKYAEEEENQPSKKRKNAKNDSKTSEKKGKTLRSNTPTEQPLQQRNTSNDNDTGVKSPNFNRNIPPSMPHLSYNGSSKKVQVAANSKNTRIPPPLQRAPPMENEDMDVDIPENTNKPKHKELAKIVENNSPSKRISPAYSDISDANEESNSPVLGQNSTAQSINQSLGPPPKLVSRPQLPNSTAQPQPKSDSRASPSSTRLPGTPGENQFFHGNVDRNNLMINENKQSESDKKDKVQNQSVMKPPYPQMKQSPLVQTQQSQQLPKPNNLMAGQKVADQITREAAQQKQHTVQNMHRMSNQQPRHQNYNPKQFNRGPPQNFPRPNNSGNFVHPNSRLSGYSSSTASAAIAATQRGYGNNMGVPMQKR